MTRALGIEAAAAATAASDPALAVSLVEHVLSAYDALTDVLAPKVVTETALRAEAADAFRFVQGTNEDRTGIIIRRLRFVEDRLPACHSWPAPCCCYSSIEAVRGARWRLWQSARHGKAAITNRFPEQKHALPPG